MTKDYFIYTDNAIGTADPVNLSLLITFEKFEDMYVSVPNGKHQIHFKRVDPFSGPKDIIWKYDDKECRDAEFDKIKSNFLTNISTIQ